MGYDARVPPSERDPEVSRAFGRAVQIARVRRGLTRSRLAAQAGIPSPSTIGRIERGERDPILSQAVRLALALGLTPGQLMDAMQEERGRV